MDVILQLVIVTVWYSRVISTEIENSTITYVYGFKCYFGHQRLDLSSVVYIQYEGDPILCDEIFFLGQDATNGNKYQLCLTPVYYHDPYCEIFVEYKSYLTGQILQTLRCKDNNTNTWCSEETDNLSVRIKMESFVRQRTEARVKMRLEVKPKTYRGIFLHFPIIFCGGRYGT
ncbi:uncharacterized protein LOC133194273 [Saccostrea echinata]|uniref:uncharacterized protein LOC133194273 n=1 Tax=Saccostrea echinata TaxID=191078 RepID=UPI002A7F0AE1|nr:uncharacterized protein LOC133194273 [Saccostrea echinata]